MRSKVIRKGLKVMSPNLILDMSMQSPSLKAKVVGTASSSYPKQLVGWNAVVLGNHMHTALLHKVGNPKVQNPFLYSLTHSL